MVDHGRSVDRGGGALRAQGRHLQGPGAHQHGYTGASRAIVDTTDVFLQNAVLRWCELLLRGRRYDAAHARSYGPSSTPWQRVTTAPRGSRREPRSRCFGDWLLT